MMKQTKKEQRGLPWGRACLLAVALLICVSWVCIDALFSPLDRGGRSVEIPDYRGQLLDRLQFADWMEIETDYRYDADAPADTVLSQSPYGGSLRKLTKEAPTCRISLVVSLGAESVVLPDFFGEDARVAEAQLRELGFSVEICQCESPYPRGSVFQIEPQPGETLPKGARVVLYVAMGERTESVEVPELCGLSRADALVRIWLAKLSLGEITEIESDAPDGTVIAQSHRPGTLVAAGTKISFSVAGNRETE